MTRPIDLDLPNISPQQLLTAAQQIVQRYPDCELVKNHVGNLTIVAADGTQIGHVNLRNGDIEIWNEDEPES